MDRQRYKQIQANPQINMLESYIQSLPVSWYIFLSITHVFDPALWPTLFAHSGAKQDNRQIDRQSDRQTTPINFLIHKPPQLHCPTCTG